MMRRRLQQLAQRRQELIARCSMQRERLVLQSQRWTGPMSSVDTVLSLPTRIRQHPGWFIAGTSALAIALIAIKPRRLSNLWHTMSTAMRTWQMMQPVVHKLLTSSPP